MKILVTGANGFLGKSLISELNNRAYEVIYKVTGETKEEDIERYTMDCDFIFHLGGVNRFEEEKEFMEGNLCFTSKLLELLEKHNNKAPILLISSIQGLEDNYCDKSKKAEEDLLFKYGKEAEVNIFAYRLTNLFGKLTKSDYNSVVATFSYNIARDMEVQINDPEAIIELSYINDVMNEFINTMNGLGSKDGKYYKVPIGYNIKIKDLRDLIKSFKASRKDLLLLDMKDELTRKLYSSYLSYLP